MAYGTDNHIEDAKGLGDAVRFVGRSLDEDSMVRESIEALANALEEHLEVIAGGYDAALGRPAAS